MNMKKYTLILTLALICGTVARADEGMWLPCLINERIADMQAKGFRLSAEDVYSVNQASLKDAVVLFGSGCTGELVSGDGLLFTNHHCGYSFIQRHSSVEHDYLRDGFWAMNRSEELTNPGLTVKFLERMDDVTSVVLKGWRADMSEQQRDSLVKANAKPLYASIDESKGYRGSLEALYYGNQYFFFTFREYSDVRLVGAPASAIGKFGGDTDNWMWPRHTGDFSIFRVYADKNNDPAKYSPDNVPYHPKKFFTISTEGVKEGDFTFIYGCPGSTTEYLTSAGVRYIEELSDPLKIELRTIRLDVQKKYMSQSQAVRIQYSSKNASTANAWKKWQGEVIGLRRNAIIERKRQYEAGLRAWSAGGQYEGLIEDIAAVYKLMEPYALACDLFRESAGTFELGNFATRAVRSAKNGAKDVEAQADAFFKDYCEKIDRESYTEVMKVFDRESKGEFRPAVFDSLLAVHGSVEALVDHLFTGSVFTSKESLVEFVSMDPDPVENIMRDPVIEYYNSMIKWYQYEMRPRFNAYNSELNLLYRKYMKAQMDYSPDKEFYPDANLTLRVAYGNVKGYEPRDGVYYSPVSTLTGIIEKDNPEIFDYNIPQTLRDVYAAGGVDKQPVCFLATNHTTGGNSGSPVINADGCLIGINFDRVWEGTMSDVAFDPAFCRNISLDVRYLLFVIDRIGGASYLFDEMSFSGR